MLSDMLLPEKKQFVSDYHFWQDHLRRILISSLNGEYISFLVLNVPLNLSPSIFLPNSKVLKHKT